jgi:hypothetical protein
MKHIQGQCPIYEQCGLEYSKEFFHNDTVVFPWKCDCGASGREVYYLSFMYHENLAILGKYIAEEECDG